MFEKNEILSLGYVVDSSVNTGSVNFRDRSGRVKAVRDLLQEPLTIREYLRRPMVRRGRYLLRVYDLGTNQYRQWYLNNSREYWFDSQLRVGVFEGPKLVDIISRGYDPSERERLILARALVGLLDFNLQPHLRFGVFSDDLRVRRDDTGLRAKAG